MSIINNVHNEFKSQPVHAGKKDLDAEIALARLSALIGELCEELSSSEGQTAPASSSASRSSDGPTNGDMERAYAALIGLLANMQCDIAKYSNTLSQTNAEIGRSLMNQMQKQFEKTIDDVKKLAEEQAKATFWSTFVKWLEGIVAGLGIIVSALCGQPALAAVIFTFTVLSLSGGMEKITQAIADKISEALVKDGVPKEQADKIAKVLADIIIVVITIVATAMTGGAAGAGAAGTAAQGSANAAANAAAQNIESAFDKLITFCREFNPFSKLSRTTNFSILTGSMAFGGTGLGKDIMVAACMNMKDDKSKEILQTVMSIILNVLAGLAGAGAGGAVCTGTGSQLNNTLKNLAEKLKAMLGIKDLNLSTALSGALGLQFLGGLTQAGGQIASGAVKVDLAKVLFEQGETQALLSTLQSLVKMNSAQADSGNKELAAKMKTWAEEITHLAMRLTDVQSALARELQA